MSDEQQEPQAADEMDRRRRWRGAVGYLVALVCLVWVFHDIDFRRMLADMTAIRWGWVVVAVILDVLAYVFQGWRWQLLLRPMGQVSVRRSTQAVYVGLFANEVLPLRAGEVIRMFLVARWMDVQFAAVIPSVVMERFFDGIWLVMALAVAGVFVPLPRPLLEAEEILGAGLIVLAGVLLSLAFRRPRPMKHGKDVHGLAAVIQHLRMAFEHFTREVRRIRESRLTLFSFLVSGPLLLLQVISFWLVMVAYGIDLGLVAGTAVLLIVHLGTAIPNAPSNVGTYQFFTVLGLTLFGVSKTLATGFSVVVFIIMTAPLWLLGFLALGQTGMTLSTIRSRIRNLPEP